MKPMYALLIASLFLIGGCRSHKDVQLSSQSHESEVSDIDLSSFKATDLSAILSSDRDVVLSDIDIIFSPTADSGGSAAPVPAAPIPTGPKVRPSPAKIRIGHIDIKDRQNSFLSAHTESADSINAGISKNTSDISNEETIADAEVFKPPSLLLLLAFAVAATILIFILKQIYKSLSK